MSNAKVRARRRRRGNRAWTKAMQPEVYSVTGQTPWGSIRQPGKSNFWKQLAAAADMQPKLDELIRERYPHAVFVHDECVIEGSTADIEALTGRIEATMKNWHKSALRPSWGYAATLRVMPTIVPPGRDEIFRRFAELDRQDAIRESCKDDLAP